MDRDYILSRMQSQMMDIDDFNFDALKAPPIYSLLTTTDVGDLNAICINPRYSGTMNRKMKLMDQILVRRGFRKKTGGNCRLVYRFLEDDSFLIKVATRSNSLCEAHMELLNQEIYKPYVAKTFEVTPCGTVGMFEQVIPIMSRQEFLSVAPVIYDIISNWFVGRQVMDDIGTNSFLNWGIRSGSKGLISQKCGVIISANCWNGFKSLYSYNVIRKDKRECCRKTEKIYRIAYGEIKALSYDKVLSVVVKILSAANVLKIKREFND